MSSQLTFGHELYPVPMPLIGFPYVSYLYDAMSDFCRVDGHAIIVVNHYDVMTIERGIRVG